MSVYQDYPALEECLIHERVSLARRSALTLLQQGAVTPDELLSAMALLLENERYEVAAGTQEAISQFQARPQLALF